MRSGVADAEEIAENHRPMIALLRWQWDGYPRYHRSRFNLWLHLAVVPLFWAGNLAIVAAIAGQTWPPAVGGIIASVLSIALQGRGHRAEGEPPVPFSSPFNAIGRIFLEQWINFPRFVLSGKWSEALRAAKN